MADINNIKDVIKKSQKLKFTSVSNIVQHSGGFRTLCILSADTVVDYKNKTAVQTTATTQNNQRFAVRARYKNGECVCRAFNITKQTEEGPKEKKKLSPEEYNKLFLPGGSLRPVVFDYLTVNTNENNLTNTMEAALLLPKEQQTEGFNSNVIFTVCSAQTLKINSLAVYGEDNKNVTSTDTEIIVHLYNGEVN